MQLPGFGRKISVSFVHYSRHRMCEIRGWRIVVEGICTRSDKGPRQSNRIFKFGNNDTFRSKGEYMIPLRMEGKNWTMELDFIEVETPLLMSRDMMKEMKMVIDLEDDTALVEGKKVNLRTTKSGIYIMPLEEEGKC